MKCKHLKKLVGIAVIAGSLPILATEAKEVQTTKTTETKQTDSTSRDARQDKPGYFYFEEDWIGVPAEPMANLDIVGFAKGSSTLTANEKNKLRGKIASLGKDQVKEAYIAVYADHLREGTKDLPKQDQTLVRQRAKTIRDFLEDGFGIDTVTFNMATRPGWWARLWHTENAKVKEANNTSRDWIADLLRDHSQASSATVVFTTRNNPKVAE